MSWKAMLRYLAERGKEPSTWRGVVWGITALGISVAPELIEPITVFGMATAGLLGAAFRN